MSQEIAASFEKSFMTKPLSKQISDCDDDELAPVILKLFADVQPVLEAGCGSGRWCAWLQSHGIVADGVDWSSSLCERAAKQIPGSRFYACDMSSTGLPDCTYGGLLALGSIEHTVEGPMNALFEFHRLLRPGGMALITVPHGGWLRRLGRIVRTPHEVAKGVALIRRLTGKAPLAAGARSRRSALQGTVAAWHPRTILNSNGSGWSFYEYEFSRRQLDTFVTDAGFEIQDRFTVTAEQGLFHSFGRLAGMWNQQESRVELSVLGKLLRRTLPISVTGHMLCYIVTKPA